MKRKSTFILFMLQRSSWLSLSVLAATLTLTLGIVPRVVAQATSSQIVISPSLTVPMLAGTKQPVSVAYGDQANPRIDCNTVSYTFDNYEGLSTIHYFDLATGIDRVAPGNTLDRLSDVKGNRVAFTELTADGDRIMIYDTVTNTRVALPAYTVYPRMGGNDLVFWKYNYASARTTDEIGIYDMTTGAVSFLTNDSMPDKYPAVSPNGNAIVWLKCLADGTSCHVYSAIQTSPGVFTTQALTSGPNDEEFPQTDGQIVTYISNKSGENDIYYQPVGGGIETRIVIPGDQREPTISGNLLSFESNQTGLYEVFVYDLSSGTLYQVTTTSNFDSPKALNDISVCNGTGNIVYSVPGGFGDFDIYAFTFQPPDPPRGRITDLIALVRSFGLPNGIQTSLVVKLQDAIAALNTNDTSTACAALGDFVSEVNAQSGKKLTIQQAGQLIDAARAIKASLGCQ